MIGSFRMVSTSPITLQRLVQIEQHVPAVGANIKCLCVQNVMLPVCWHCSFKGDIL